MYDLSHLSVPVFSIWDSSLARIIAHSAKPKLNGKGGIAFKGGEGRGVDFFMYQDGLVNIFCGVYTEYENGKRFRGNPLNPCYFLVGNTGFEPVTSSV